MTGRTLLDLPPQRLVDGERFAAGRFRYGVPDPNLDAPAGRLKQWHYVAWTTPEWMLVTAVVDVGYLGNLFGYFLEFSDPQRIWQVEALSPLARAVSVALSSLAGTTRWHTPTESVEITGESGVDGAGHWHVQLDLPLQSGGEIRRLQADFTVQGGEALALAWPLLGRHRVYTHKEAAQVAQGTVTIGEKTWKASGLATLDWTRGYHLHRTEWLWASLAAQLPGGDTVGLNLSALVYDDQRGASQENALWWQGHVWPLAGVRFELPLEPECEPWHIVSQQPGELDLRFEPWGARRQNLNLLAIVSRYVQPYGRFFGTLRPPGSDAVLTLAGAVGVTEQHLARW
jgi:hypothetical protein